MTNENMLMPGQAEAALQVVDRLDSRFRC